LQDLDLANQLRDRLALLLDIDASSIKNDVAFADLDVDSMMRLELISIVEKFVGYEIPEQDLPQLQTINHVLNYVGIPQ